MGSNFEKNYSRADSNRVSLFLKIKGVFLLYSHKPISEDSILMYYYVARICIGFYVAPFQT